MQDMGAVEACRLVTTNNVDVFRLLGSQAVGRLGLDYSVASDQDQLLPWSATIRRGSP